MRRIRRLNWSTLRDASLLRRRNNEPPPHEEEGSPAREVLIQALFDEVGELAADIETDLVEVINEGSTEMLAEELAHVRRTRSNWRQLSPEALRHISEQLHEADDPRQKNSSWLQSMTASIRGDSSQKTEPKGSFLQGLFSRDNHNRKDGDSDAS